MPVKTSELPRCGESSHRAGYHVACAVESECDSVEAERKADINFRQRDRGAQSNRTLKLQWRSQTVTAAQARRYKCLRAEEGFELPRISGSRRVRGTMHEFLGRRWSWSRACVMRRRALWHASIGVRGHLNSHCSGRARALGGVHDGSWALTSPTIVCIASWLDRRMFNWRWTRCCMVLTKI